MQHKIVAVHGLGQRRASCRAAARAPARSAAASAAARPLAKSSPSAPQTVTASPAPEAALHRRARRPASRLAPPRSSARRAPASTTQRPVARLAVAQPQLERRHRPGVAREARPDGRGRRPRRASTPPARPRRSRSPRRRPRPSRPRRPSSACRPSPSALPGRRIDGRARASSRWSSHLAHELGARVGRVARVEPSASVSSTSRRARSRTATWAASASLSPNVISSVAVESFSLTTGTMPQRSSVSSVARAFRYEVRACRSAAVSSTWATRGARRRQRRLPGVHSSAWPSAEAACSRARRSGRPSRPSAPSPSAMAPDETTQTRHALGPQRRDLAPRSGQAPAPRAAPAVDEGRRAELDDERAPHATESARVPPLVSVTGTR